MLVKELTEYLKKHKFHNLSGLKKSELNALYTKHKQDKKVPFKYQRKLKLGEPCEKNIQCFTKNCVDNKCSSATSSTEKELKPLKENFEKITNNKLEDCKKYKNFKLKEHQEKVIDFYLNSQQKGLVVFHSTGSGKSSTAIATAKCLLAKHPDKRIIILTPTSVVKQFIAEMNKMGVEEEIQKRINIYTHITWLQRYKNKQVNAKNAVLIIDEAHKFKTNVTVNKKTGKIKGIYTKTLLEASKEAFKIMLLTATPLENRVKEVLNYLTMIDGKKPTLEAVKNHPEKELKCKFSYFKSLQNIDDYPSVDEKFIYLDMSKEYERQFEYIVKLVKIGNFLKEGEEFDEDAYDDKLEPFYNAMRRAVNQISTPSPKIKWIVKKIQRDIKTKNKKCVIYSSFIDFGVGIIEKKLTQLGISFRIIQGSLSAAKRNEYVKEYNNDKVKVLLITNAGSEGLDLKGTRAVYIVEPFWHLSKLHQVVGRAVRYGSHSHLPKNERNVKIYKLVLKGSLDKFLYDKCKEKFLSITQFYKTLENQSIENQKCY